MTIPPIGSNPAQPSPLDDKRTENSAPEKADIKLSSEKTELNTTQPTEKVEITTDTGLIRARQNQITSLQIAERTTEQVIENATQIETLVLRHHEASVKGDGRAQEIEVEIESQITKLESRTNQAVFEGQNLLDGREMTFEINSRTERIQTPDFTNGIDRYVKTVRDSVSTDRKLDTGDFIKRAQEFGSSSKTIRTRLEQDVRDSIVGAVRESSTTEVKDAADAERLIQKARDARPKVDSQTSKDLNQIEGQAINLLK